MYGKKMTGKTDKPKPPAKDPKDWTNSDESKLWGKQFALATNKPKQAAIAKARQGSGKSKMQRGIDKIAGK